jgi:hypothetical protein
MKCVVRGLLLLGCCLPLTAAYVPEEDEIMATRPSGLELLSECLTQLYWQRDLLFSLPPDDFATVAGGPEGSIYALSRLSANVARSFFRPYQHNLGGLEIDERVQLSFEDAARNLEGVLQLLVSRDIDLAPEQTRVLEDIWQTLGTIRGGIIHVLNAIMVEQAL